AGNADPKLSRNSSAAKYAALAKRTTWKRSRKEAASVTFAVCQDAPQIFPPRSIACPVRETGQAPSIRFFRDVRVLDREGGSQSNLRAALGKIRAAHVVRRLTVRVGEVTRRSSGLRADIGGRRRHP